MNLQYLQPEWYKLCKIKTNLYYRLGIYSFGEWKVYDRKSKGWKYLPKNEIVYRWEYKK